MSEKEKFNWDPKSEEVQKDQRAAFDRMRQKCPVAHSDLMQWTLFRHEDISRVLHDHETFSNEVSMHLSVPNGMDPPTHKAYRKIVDKYFTPERMEWFEPICRVIAADVVEKVLSQGEVEFMESLALPFAVQNQCAFMNWPKELHDQLTRWTQKNHEATFAQDHSAMSKIAEEFEELINNLIEDRIKNEIKPEEDILASLMQEEVWERKLNRKEISSILRNWTVGEIGTISASVGILAHFIAQNREVQEQLRSDISVLPDAIDEILRIHGPLIANRRVTTQAVEIAGRKFEAGDRLSINWISANRDEKVFEKPDEFRLDRDPSKNLLYGAGIHVCPGAPLARLELRVIMEELLSRTNQIIAQADKQPVYARYPASGFSVLPLDIQ